MGENESDIHSLIVSYNPLLPTPSEPKMGLLYGKDAHDVKTFLYDTDSGDMVDLKRAKKRK